MVIARGEAVRNFVFSDTLRVLSEQARVTLLSTVDHGDVMDRAQPYAGQILPLKEYRDKRWVAAFRHLVHTAHFRWLWSEAVRYYWGLHDARARTVPAKAKRVLLKAAARSLAYRPTLELLTKVEQYLSWRLCPTHDFDQLFRQIQPDLVFNCSHIHGETADLPLRVAHAKGIPTAGFIFSWDNLTSRSRIFVPYDYYIMWNEDMKRHLLTQYPRINPDRVLVTGTPQFDFHFKPEFELSREEICRRIGLDPQRPFVLYTTGLDTDFPEEHRIVEAVIRFLKEPDLNPKPQLVVRTYIKGTAPEMLALGTQNTPDVVFPPILWDRQWIMPLYEDLYIYTNLIRLASLGINVASTVSLELMMFDKPVINLGFEPPDSKLPYYSRFSRHVEYEHYRPVVGSGGVMVARSLDDLRTMIRRGLADPGADSDKRTDFIRGMLGEKLDGNSGRRVALQLLRLTGLDCAVP